MCRIWESPGRVPRITTSFTTGNPSMPSSGFSPSSEVVVFAFFPVITSSSPLGRSIRNVRPGGTQDPATRLNKGTHNLSVHETRGSHERGFQGVTLFVFVFVVSFPPSTEPFIVAIAVNASTALLIPSSWNPYPHHAPAKYTWCLPLFF